MKISREKIQARLDSLNASEARDGLQPVPGSATTTPEGPWVEVEDQAALMEAKFEGEKANFNVNRAVIVKLFHNTQSGELKLYPFALFTED